jgi:hypothetical protein
LGCGAGLLGVYLGALGADVLMADVPSVRDLALRNINLNKSIIKGKVEFITANWYEYLDSGNERAALENAKKCPDNPAPLQSNGNSASFICFQRLV